MRSNYKILGTSIFTAIASSLCCIMPVLALISGTTGVASTFSWLEPLRPYLIGFTILVLGFAWYQKLKPKKEMDCDCETFEKPPFLQSKLFLGIITVFAIMMAAFPHYSAVFYPENEIKTVIVNQSNIQYLNVDIEGMTCTSCEKHINLTVNQLDGIIE